MARRSIRAPRSPLTKEFPPASKRFDGRMIDTAERLIQHPYRTLKGEVLWKGPYDREQGLRLVLTLTNTGIVPVKIPNPAAAAKDDEVGLRMEPPRRPPRGRARPQPPTNYDVRRGEVEQAAAPGAEPGDKPDRLITLDVGEPPGFEYHASPLPLPRPGTTQGLPDIRIPGREDR